MATLTVWRFDSPDGAVRAAQVLEDLGRDDAAELHDAAVVTWELRHRKPHTRQLASPALTGSLGAGFWGLFFGLVFFLPLLGAAVGTAGGALAGVLSDVGIDDHFINRIRDQVTPGTSALFVLGTAAAVDRLHAGFAAGPRADRIATDLDDEHEAALREVFGD